VTGFVNDQREGCTAFTILAFIMPLLELEGKDNYQAEIYFKL